MKKKTLLSFILCFLMIGCLSQTYAAIGCDCVPIDTDMVYDYENNKTEYICNYCGKVKYVADHECRRVEFYQEGDEYEHTLVKYCMYNECGITSFQKSEPHGKTYMAYISNGNGTHAILHCCEICDRRMATGGDAEPCDWKYKPVSGTQTHKKVIDCSCGYKNENRYAAEACKGEVVSKNGDTTKYRCTVCGNEWSKDCVYEVKSTKSNKNGTHTINLVCKDCGQTKNKIENCGRSYIALTGNMHKVKNNCTKCRDYTTVIGEESCRGQVVNVVDDGMINYKCQYCTNTWQGKGVNTNLGIGSGGFFGAADAGIISNAKTAINGELSPIKHVQSLIMLVGAIAAVIVVLVYGIQWTMATSAKRQELKAGMWPLAIGVILLSIGPKLALDMYGAFNNVAGQDVTDVKVVNDIGGIVINTIQTIGYLVAVVMVLYIGIQYLQATPAKRNELKGRMINLIIGAVLIAGGVSILGWIYNAAEKDMKVSVLPQYLIENNQSECNEFIC